MITFPLQVELKAPGIIYNEEGREKKREKEKQSQAS